MRTKSLLFAGLIAVLLFSGSVASAQVSCAGLPAFANCTAYANGASVTFNGSKWTAIAPIPNNRDCPPNSPYTPATDNWWTNNGTCSTTATATATKAPTATATAVRATATPTSGGATATRTNTATATPTTGTSSSANYTAAFWTQGNDPCTSSGAPGSGQPWGPPTACTTNCAAAWNASTAYNGGAVVSRSCGGSNPTATATKAPTATATSTGPTATATRTNTATATPTTVTGGGGFPARFVAPYVATWNNPNLATLASSTGNKYWTMAFIINGSGTCNPMWNGDTALTTTYNVAGLRAAGGDAIVSFGGASGVEIAASCTDVASTQAAYQKVINAFGAKAIDLDIESGYESDAASIDRRNKAMKGLQSANPGLRVDYTLGVSRTGLPAAQQNVIANAKSNGVNVGSVNIMAMDYGPCYTDMGQAAIDAANGARNQTGLPIGITPMIGVNDVSCENFTTNDANILVSWAQGQSFVNLLAYWVQDADSSHSYINIFKTFH